MYLINEIKKRFYIIKFKLLNKEKLVLNIRFKI